MGLNEALKLIGGCPFLFSAENINESNGVRIELPGWVHKSGGPYSAINIICMTNHLHGHFARIH
jgi:hypothetical protein